MRAGLGTASLDQPQQVGDHRPLTFDMPKLGIGGGSGHAPVEECPFEMAQQHSTLGGAHHGCGATAEHVLWIVSV